MTSILTIIILVLVSALAISCSGENELQSTPIKTVSLRTPIPTKLVTPTPIPIQITPTPPPAIVFTPAPTSPPVIPPSPPPNEPVLKIPEIGINAPFVERGLDAQARMEGPETGEEVTWYRFSGLPGQGRNIVLAGHVQLNRRPAVFAGLDELAIGDEVIVKVDGQEHQYVVTDSFYVPNDYPPAELTADNGAEQITMITCGGVWIPDPRKIYGGDYSDRLIVVAKHK